MEDFDFRDINKIRSIVETHYEVKEKVKEGWFSNTKYLEEKKSSTEKVIFDSGAISKRELLVFRKDVTYRHSYEYRNGLEMVHKVVNQKGDVLSEEKKEYFPNNKLKGSVRYDYKDGKLESEVTCMYDQYGNLLEYISYNGTRPKSISYSSKNKWVYGISEYGGDLKICNREDNSKEREIHYDSKNRIRKWLEFEKRGKVKSSIEYVYDAQGRIFKRILDWCHEEEYKYDVYGNVIRRKWYPNYDMCMLDSPYHQQDKYKESISTFEYRYDNFGNKVESRTFRDGAYVWLTTWEIEYY